MKNFNLCAFADEASAALDGQISALKENGISLLEIRGVEDKNVSKLTLPEAKQIKSRLDGEGISVYSIGSPIGKIKITDNFSEHLDLLRHVLELAEILGAENLRIFSFYLPKNEPHERYRDIVLEKLDRFCEAAKDSGVTLCHENEKGIFGEDAPSCLAIHKALPSLRAVFDPANFVQVGKDTLSAFEMLSPYVKYMHIKDSTREGKIVPSGKGIGNIAKLLTMYSGEVLSLEPHLAVFRGLDALENEEKSAVDPFVYPTQRAAFDAAANALKQIKQIKEIT